MDWAWLQSNWASIIEFAAKIVGLVVIVGGPLVALFKQIRSRTYAVRVELSVAGKIFRADNQSFLHIVSSVKNVGVSHVKFKPSISYVRIFALEIDSSNPDQITSTRLATLPALLTSDSLESGLSAEDSQLFKISHENYLAFLIEFGFTSKGFLGLFPGRDWTRTTITNCKLKPESANSS